MKIPSYLQEKKKTSNSQFFQKLVPHNFFSSNSIIISKYIIRNIPYYHEFFLPIQSYKNAKISDSDEKFILIITENKGETKSFYDLFYEKNDKKIMNIYFHGFKTLLLTCQIMIQHGLVHFDVSPNTISFVDDRPYLHNFSHGFQLSNMTDERKSKLFEKSSSYNIHYPPSYHILNYIIQNNLKEVSASVVDYILQEYIENAVIQKLNFSENDWNHFRNFWSRYLINKKNEQLLWKESLHWDTYSIFILHLEFLPRENSNIILEKFSEFLKKNVSGCYCLNDIIDNFIF